MDPLIIVLTGTAVVLFCIIFLRMHAAISLILAAFVTALLTSPGLILEFGLHSGMSPQEAEAFARVPLGKRVAAGFGNTSSKIGILIALASIIGTALMRSGAAERIIRALLGLFGKKNAPLAFLSGSFTLAIPVFFDTVFYLMIPLVKSVAVRNPARFSLYLMCTIAGGVMAHSLIPPTPGPLFVAEEMGIDLGAMILGGLVIGGITVVAGYFYALWANRRWILPLRDTPDIDVEELSRFSLKEKSELPPLAFSVLPIVLPIILITASTFSRMGKEGSVNTGILEVIATFGDANVALLISALFALRLLWTAVRDIKAYREYLKEALSAAGMIILITSAGGAFGQMMQQTGVGIRIGEMTSGFQMAILPLAFLVTAAVRSAQGSATVAMITSIGMMGSLAAAELAFHPVYLALAIGCGSKVFAWMNDSGFWIITKMTGMDEQEAVRHFSFLLLVMGLTGLVAVMALSWLFPFSL